MMMDDHDIRACIRTILKDGPNDVPTITKIIYPEMPYYNRSHRQTKIRHHLVKMERDGEVTHTPGERNGAVTIWRLRE